MVETKGFILSSTRGSEWISVVPAEELPASWVSALFAVSLGYTTWTAPAGEVEKTAFAIEVPSFEVQRASLAALDRWLAQVDGPSKGVFDSLTVVGGAPGFAFEFSDPDLISNQWQTAIKVTANLSAAMTITLEILGDETSVNSAREGLAELLR